MRRRKRFAQTVKRPGLFSAFPYISSLITAFSFSPTLPFYFSCIYHIFWKHHFLPADLKWGLAGRLCSTPVWYTRLQRWCTTAPSFRRSGTVSFLLEELLFLTGISGARGTSQHRHTTRVEGLSAPGTAGWWLSRPPPASTEETHFWHPKKHFKFAWLACSSSCGSLWVGLRGCSSGVKWHQRQWQHN